MNDREDRPTRGTAEVDLEERRARRRERAAAQPRPEPGVHERSAGQGSLREAGSEVEVTEEVGGRDRAPAPDEGMEDRATLLAGSEAERFRARWKDIQTGFVDAPRRAVNEADSLVADVLDRIQDVFTRERESLEGQWQDGDEPSTEDLRQGLHRYREFFDRLLSL